MLKVCICKDHLCPLQTLKNEVDKSNLSVDLFNGELMYTNILSGRGNVAVKWSSCRVPGKHSRTPTREGEAWQDSFGWEEKAASVALLCPSRHGKVQPCLQQGQNKGRRPEFLCHCSGSSSLSSRPGSFALSLTVCPASPPTWSLRLATAQLFATWLLDLMVIMERTRRQAGQPRVTQ